MSAQKNSSPEATEAASRIVSRVCAYDDHDSTLLADLDALIAAVRADERQQSAAPALYEALKAIVEHEQIDGTGIRYAFDWHSPYGKAARAALAKAEGR